MNSTDFLAERLKKREREGLLRQLSLPGDLVDFSSNDYLGFARSKELQDNIQAAVNQLSLHGATGSRLLSGNYSLIEETERLIAGFHNADAGLIFNSGYDANLGLFSSIGTRNDTIIYDELIHSSIKDGARLSLASAYSIRHNDVGHLEQKLKAARGNVFVVVESVYSMDGDLAPLKDIAAVLKEHPQAHLIVDEAHATGVFGESGKGLVYEYGLADSCLARVHTFGKALGCHGAIVLGSYDLRNYLINFARSFIYTTALPQPSVVAIEKSYQMLMTEPGKAEALKKILDHFTKTARKAGLDFISHESAIRSVIIPGNDRVRSIARVLQVNGFDVRPILSPTVQAGKERLRICLHAYNSEREVTALLNHLSELI